MSETVQIALITALSGVGGAILGATAAVLGPWLIQRNENRARDRKLKRDSRLRSIVDFGQIGMKALAEVNPESSLLPKRHAETLNQALMELHGTIENERVLDWITELGLVTAYPAISNYARQIYVGTGTRMLLKWHRTGELPEPFICHVNDGHHGLERRDEWPSNLEIMEHIQPLEGAVRAGPTP